MTTPSSVPARGAGLSRVALVGGVLVAAALGIGTFQFLATLDPVSISPFDGTGGWFALVVAGLLAGAFALLLAVVAVIVARPRAVALVALATCVLLPVAALAAGGLAGMEMLRLHMAADLADGGTAVLATFEDSLRAVGADPRPLLDYLSE
jgi:hypothetical protein